MRKRPINVECQVDDLSIEALDWLDNCAQDLSWIHRRWRIWESEATFDELSPEDKVAHRHYKVKGWPFTFPMKKRSVDVVRFASNADAMYFKLKFV